MRSKSTILAEPKICSVDGCGREIWARGWCHAHCQCWYRTGDPGPAEIRTFHNQELCSIEGCGTPRKGRDWCTMHYQRWLQTGGPGPAGPLPLGGPPGPEHPRWKGSEAGYSAIHDRLNAQRGKASSYICACGTPAAHWSYDWTDPGQLVDDRGRVYSTDLDCYTPMCASCHKRWDLAQWED